MSTHQSSSLQHTHYQHGFSKHYWNGVLDWHRGSDSICRYVNTPVSTRHAPLTIVGLTAQDSVSIVPMILHAPPKLMAKQWLTIYQCGPYWVRPLCAAGTLCNGYLAWIGSPGLQQNLYIAATIAMGSVLPITFLFFEPGVNGACKWKVQSLLRDEGFEMPPFNGLPSSVRHSATASTKAWADKTDMSELVSTWGQLNHGRWIIGLLAAGLSGFATLL